MESHRYPLAIIADPQIITIQGADGGQHQLVIGWETLPSAGQVTVEMQLVGESTWRAIDYATAISVLSGMPIWTYGGVRAYRVTFSGIVGGSAPGLWVTQLAPQGFPDGAFKGTRALTVQSYTEANVKRGLEYYVRAVWPLGEELTPGSSRYVYFELGDKPISVKLRDMHYVAEELTLRLFRDPVGVSGGTPLDIHNFNRINAVPTSMVDVRKNVAVTGEGTPFDANDPEYYFGSNQQGARTQISIPEGRERIIPAFSRVLIKITNTAAQGNARVQYFLDWYEGRVDFPIP